jgi:hypothetical protein
MGKKCGRTVKPMSHQQIISTAMVVLLQPSRYLEESAWLPIPMQASRNIYQCLEARRVQYSLVLDLLPHVYKKLEEPAIDYTSNTLTTFFLVPRVPTVYNYYC